MVLITHKLADVAACADRIVVMRGGRVVDQALSGERSPQAAGRRDGRIRTGRGACAPAACAADVGAVLQVRGLCAEHEGRSIRDISFDLPPGEILGIAGVSGNGQFTLAEALAGLIPVSGGDVVLCGMSIASHGQFRAIADERLLHPGTPDRQRRGSRASILRPISSFARRGAALLSRLGGRSSGTRAT